MSRARPSRRRAAHGGAAGGGAAGGGAAGGGAAGGGAAWCAVGAASNGAAAPPLPAGFGVAFDSGTKQLAEDILFGGAPARVLRLSRTGRAALAELWAGPVRSGAAGRLARKLTDTGLAHPRPPAPAARPDVTVLIPVRDRAVLLDRCLSALGDSYPVLVVDDGSEDPGAVADVAAAHGAALVRRPVNGGPGAARNTGLLSVATDLVAFLDSDCVPEPGWIERLAAHLADPAVAAAAPRMVAVPAGPSWAGRYTTAACCLDLGDAEARVVPGTRVAYVPTAALVVRRAALARGAGAGSVFDPALRWGEDVDLVWRLHAAGWRNPLRAGGPGIPPRAQRLAGAACAAVPLRLLGGAAGVAAPWPGAAVGAAPVARADRRRSARRQPRRGWSQLQRVGGRHAPDGAQGRAARPWRGARDARWDPADLAGHWAIRLSVRCARAGRRARGAGRRWPGAALGPAGGVRVTAAGTAVDGLVRPPQVAGPGAVRARPPGRRRGLRSGRVGGRAAGAQHGPGTPGHRLAPVPRRRGARPSWTIRRR